MNIRKAELISALILVACAASAQNNPKPAVPPNVSSGKQTYVHHCASCHGDDGRGNGPTSSALKTPPPDLTTLAIHHNGKFPEEYVAGVVRFGKPVSAHGSSDMPVWGPVFSVLENGNEVAVRQRIKELCDYLASIQDKES